MSRISATPLSVCVLQAGKAHSRRGNPGFEANFSLFADLVRKAARRKPDLIVLPEYAISGWPYPDGEGINKLAEEIPGSGTWYGRCVDLTRAARTALLCWLVEKDDGNLYSTAFLLEKDGVFLGKYRKVHANLAERALWGWSQGDSLAPITFRGISLGISICADMFVPETVRCESLLGARLIVHQSIADDMTDVVPVRARDSGIPIVASIFKGGSYAVDAKGKILGKLGPEKAGWKIFRLDPLRGENRREWLWPDGLWAPRKGWLNTRNPSAYGVLIEPSTRPPWTEIFLDSRGEESTEKRIRRAFRGRYDANDPSLYHLPLVSFPRPWTSPYRVDPEWPFHFVNRESERLFILGKTAWPFFGCRDPEGFLERSRRQGVNVIRAALEGNQHVESGGVDLWPWRGTRIESDFSGFNQAYWRRVERLIRLAGAMGMGFWITLYTGMEPEEDRIEEQKPYWQHALRNLGRFANVLLWEIAGECAIGEAFQDAAARYFKKNDPYGRPVGSSGINSDSGSWLHKPWMGVAISPTTASAEEHDLRFGHLAIARDTRSFGKPSLWCGSGRTDRHKDDDVCLRRKQGWIWCASGGFWTHHSWEDGEGIDDSRYGAPGQGFLAPMKAFLESLPFWQLAPNETVVQIRNSDLICLALAHPNRDVTIAYVCTPRSEDTRTGVSASLRLPAGAYDVSFLRPCDGLPVARRHHQSQGLEFPGSMLLPDFLDDLLLRIEAIAPGRNPARTVREE